MDTSFNTIAYSIYLPVVIVLTIFTAVKLFKNGKIFMLDIFHGKENIANATNRLFELGFYLLNIGFALLIIEMSYLENTNELIVRLSTKLGAFTIYLGVLLMFNLLLFMKGRKKARQNNQMTLTENEQNSLSINENTHI